MFGFSQIRYIFDLSINCRQLTFGSGYCEIVSWSSFDFSLKLCADICSLPNSYLHRYKKFGKQIFGFSNLIMVSSSDSYHPFVFYYLNLKQCSDRLCLPVAYCCSHLPENYILRTKLYMTIVMYLLYNVPMAIVS